jgi:hypothetical protein
LVIPLIVLRMIDRKVEIIWAVLRSVILK